MGPIVCPETSVTNYRSTPRKIPERESRSQAGFHHHLPHCKAYYLTCFEGRILGAFRCWGLSLRVAGLLITDVSKEPIASIFVCQAVLLPLRLPNSGDPSYHHPYGRLQSQRRAVLAPFVVTAERLFLVSFPFSQHNTLCMSGIRWNVVLWMTTRFMARVCAIPFNTHPHS